MNILSKILIIAFISISLQSISAEIQDHSVDKKGIVEVSVVYDNVDFVSATGFFVSPHTLVTAFHNLDFGIIDNEKVSTQVFITHPETKKRIPARFIQALDFENDLAVLHISDYKSPVFYELSEAPEESLPSSEAHVFDRREESFPILEGTLSLVIVLRLALRKHYFYSMYKMKS